MANGQWLKAKVFLRNTYPPKEDQVPSFSKGDLGGM